MKKNWFFTLIFMLFTVGSLLAQWEKVDGQSNLLPGPTYQTKSLYQNGTLYQVTGRIYTGSTYTESLINYSKNRGASWENLRLHPNLRKEYIERQNIGVNKDGFYILIAKMDERIDTCKFYLYQTKNLGLTWTVDNVKSLVRGSKGNVSQFHCNESGAFVTLFYAGSGVDWQKSFLIHTYKCNPTNGKLGLHIDHNIVGADGRGHDQGVVFEMSKNRMCKVYDGDVTVYDLFTKAKVGSHWHQSWNQYKLYAEDSLMIAGGAVSKDSGRTFINSSLHAMTTYSVVGRRIYGYNTKQISYTDNFGVTWQNLDISAFKTGNKENITNAVFTDSLVVVNLNGRVYTKKTNETNWLFANTSTIFYDSPIRVNDTLIVASNPQNELLSTNKIGNTWKVSFNDTLNQRISVLKNGLLLNDQGGWSDDLGKTWRNVPLLTNSSIMSKVISVDSFVFFLNWDSHYNDISYSTTKPYANRKSIPKKVFSGEFAYYKQYLYFGYTIFHPNSTYSTELARIKLGDTLVEPITVPGGFAQFYKLYVDSFGLYINKLSSSILSRDFGRTWQIDSNNNGQAFKFKNFYFKYTPVNDYCGPLTPAKGGIYLSTDYGKNYSFFSGGINTDCYNFEPRFFAIDSIIYVTNWKNIWRFNTNAKTLTGVVFIDKNRNGVKDADEIGLVNAKVTLSKMQSNALTDSLGRYAFYSMLDGIDTLRASITTRNAEYTPQYLLVSPSDSVKNIPVYLPNSQDLTINLTPLTPPRNGFNNYYLLKYTNEGAITKSGTVALSLDNTQFFVEAKPTFSTYLSNRFIWNYSNLRPNESRTIEITLKTAATASIGTLVANGATIEPIATDTFKFNNIDSLFQRVVGSYDPNDKQVAFANRKTPPAIIDSTAELTYTIRFQNTGNYQADFVSVVDSLSDKLNMSTLKVLATSHSYTLTVNKNILQFDFNPIYLPDSTSNEKESHGFIKFSIKPKKTLTQDEVIRNTAYIYFDYNAAIITNTVETANQRANGVFSPATSASLSVYPNPTNGLITFDSDEFIGKELSINVYSMDGKLMLNKHTIGEAVNVINGGHLSSGLYILQVKNGADTAWGRFTVQK